MSQSFSFTTLVHTLLINVAPSDTTSGRDPIALHSLPPELYRLLAEGMKVALRDDAAFENLLRVYLDCPALDTDFSPAIPPEMQTRILRKGIDALAPEELIRFARTPAWVIAIADTLRNNALPTPSKNYSSHLRKLMPWLAAACLLAVLSYTLWFIQPSSYPIVHLTDELVPGTSLGDPHALPTDPMHKLSVSFPGSGYVYVCSQTLGQPITVAPSDTVQEIKFSDGKPVALNTRLTTVAKWRVIVCVTDNPAYKEIESVIRASNISLFTADRRAVWALRESIANVLKQHVSNNNEHPIKLLAFSPDVEVLGGK